MTYAAVAVAMYNTTQVNGGLINTEIVQQLCVFMTVCKFGMSKKSDKHSLPHDVSETDLSMTSWASGFRFSSTFARRKPQPLASGKAHEQDNQFAIALQTTYCQ